MYREVRIRGNFGVSRKAKEIQKKPLAHFFDTFSRLNGVIISGLLPLVFEVQGTFEILAVLKGLYDLFIIRDIKPYV